MAENQPKRTLVFHGEQMTWISPVSLDELLDLKAAHPKAPLLVGNTILGMYVNRMAPIAIVPVSMGGVGLCFLFFLHFHSPAYSPLCWSYHYAKYLLPKFIPVC